MGGVQLNSVSSLQVLGEAGTEVGRQKPQQITEGLGYQGYQGDTHLTLFNLRLDRGWTGNDIY